MGLYESIYCNLAFEVGKILVKSGDLRKKFPKLLWSTPEILFQMNKVEFYNRAIYQTKFL